MQPGLHVQHLPQSVPFQHAVALLTIDNETSEWGSKYHTLGWLFSPAYAPLGLLSARAFSCVGGYSISAHISEYAIISEAVPDAINDLVTTYLAIIVVTLSLSLDIP